MTNTVLIKRSSTANAVPSAGNLVAGELALNYTDGNLFYKNAGNVVTVIASNQFSSVTGNITGGNILTGGLVSATSTITSAANVTGGNLLTGGLVSAAGTITGTSHLGAVVSVTANVTGGNLLTAGQISATGTITSNAATNSTAFAVGNSAVSNVALGMFPTAGTSGEYAIRDYSNVATNLYLDVGMGGTANGAFQFRTSNAFRQLALINSSGISTPLAVSATGNVTGNYFIGNGSQLTGIVASAGASIVNGTSNVVVAASGNVTVGVAGTATVATFTTVGIIANSVATTNNGNATNFKVGDDAWLGDINVADTIGIRGQQNAANAYIVFGNADTTSTLGRSGSGPLTYAGAFSATGNVTGGNLLTAGLISSTGTITGSSHLGSVVSVTANVTGGNLLTGGLISATANITGGNILTAGIISATGNITGGNANITGTTAATSRTTGALKVGGGIGVAGDLYAGNSIVVDGGTYGNVVTTQFASLYATGAGPNPYSIVQVRSNDGTTGMGMQAYANLNGLVYSSAGITFQTGATIRDKDYPTGGTSRVTIDSTGLVANGIVSASGNVTGGNIQTVGQISATGNITGNFYIGNGAFLTGLSAGTADQIANGATSIAIPVSSGNIAMSVAGQSNTVVINLGSLTMYGTFAGPKTLAANVAVADAVNALLIGPVTLGNGFNIAVPDSSTLYVFAP
jgi:hypothetical protein